MTAYSIPGGGARIALSAAELDEAVAKLRHHRYCAGLPTEIVRSAVVHYLGIEASCLLTDIDEALDLVGDFQLSLQAAERGDSCLLAP